MHLFERMILLGGENHFLKKTKLVDSKLTLDLKSDFDYYHYACTKSYCSLSTALDKARMSIKLIDFKYIAIIDGEKYPAHSYVELFIENSIIRIQSIYDRVLIFVNKLLELGISNESINHNILVTNENVIKYGFDKKLKVLNKKFGEHRLTRNTIIHHDCFSNEDLNILSSIHFSNEIGIFSSIGSVVSESELNTLTTEYLDECRTMHHDYLAEIEKKLNELLDAACFIFADKKIKHEKNTT